MVSELRNSSTAQTQSIPAASAARACSASSAVESPSPAIWTRSSAAGTPWLNRSRSPAGRAPPGELLGVVERALVDDLGRIGLELVEVRLRLIEELLDLVGGVLGDRERLDRVDLVLDAREHHLGRKLLELGARRLVIGPESLLRRNWLTAARWSLSPWAQI